MLISGICTIYEHRPVICRLWGYPIFNNNEVSCCRKTFVEVRDLVKPIDYNNYWRASRELSIALGKEKKTSNCYVIIDLLDSLDGKGR